MAEANQVAYRVMHLSDLHRDPRNPISNDSILSCLKADAARQASENPAIGPIDAIVVSGDLVQGLSLKGEGYPDALNKQYDEAYDLLVRLADEFLAGDRARLVIAPGNHDVDWRQAKAAMAEVEPGSKDRLPDILLVADSPYRWSWEERKLFKVIDKAGYAKRMSPYRTFRRRFYEGSKVGIPLDYERSWNLFPLADGNIVVAAFESTEGNDCFRFCGEISMDAIAQAHAELLRQPKPPALAIGLWHHNASGPPLRDDYMDSEIVLRLVDCGFRLGLHGHHHRSQIQPVTIHGSGETMVLSSAGSLCAGMTQLPPGTFRQYSIIEIHAGYASARVHVRQMHVNAIFGPGHLATNASFQDVVWQAPPKPVVDPARRSGVHLAAVEAAEKATRAKDWHQVAALLAPLKPSEPYARTLLTRAWFELRDWASLVDFIAKPANAVEVTMLFEAYSARKDWSALDSLLQAAEQSSLLAAHQIQELRQRLRATKLVRR